MRLTRFTDPRAFQQVAAPSLEKHEAEHCLLLGLATDLARGTSPYGDPYLAVVEGDDGAIVAVAIRTPPYRPTLSIDAPVEALDLIAADLRQAFGSLTGVNGEQAVAEAFAARWQALTGQSARLEMAQRIYQLDAVIPVQSVPGFARRASGADRSVLFDWMSAFQAEALGSHDTSDIDEYITRRLTFDQRGLYLWNDGGPVALVGYGGLTAHGMRIGPVYTPPERRRRGYASACTAAVSQMLLDSGRRFCFLYTDLANPTSNAIYQHIGYRPVCDVAVFAFET